MNIDNQKSEGEEEDKRRATDWHMYRLQANRNNPNRKV